MRLRVGREYGLRDERANQVHRIRITHLSRAEVRFLFVLFHSHGSLRRAEFARLVRDASSCDVY